MNRIIDNGKTITILLDGLNKGKTVIDKYDWVIVKNISWTLNAYGYVVGLHKGRNTSLHRLLLGVPTGTLVDHRDKDTTNNRRNNIRIATKPQNAMNSKTQSNNTSGCRGVYLAKENDRIPCWRAYINVNKKKINLGRFKNKKDAIKARKQAEIKYFREFRNNL